METFNFLLNKTTRKKLDIIADKHARSRADIIRLMIEAEYEDDEEY